MFELLDNKTLKKVQAEAYIIARRKVTALLSARSRLVEGKGDAPLYGSRVWKDSRKLSVFGSRQNPARLRSRLSGVPEETRRPFPGHPVKTKERWVYTRSVSENTTSIRGLSIIDLYTDEPVTNDYTYFFGARRKQVFIQSKTFPHTIHPVVADWAVPDDITSDEWDEIVKASITEALEGVIK